VSPTAQKEPPECAENAENILLLRSLRGLGGFPFFVRGWWRRRRKRARTEAAGAAAPRSGSRRCKREADRPRVRRGGTLLGDPADGRESSVQNQGPKRVKSAFDADAAKVSDRARRDPARGMNALEASGAGRSAGAAASGFVEIYKLGQGALFCRLLLANPRPPSSGPSRRAPWRRSPKLDSRSRRERTAQTVADLAKERKAARHARAPGSSPRLRTAAEGRRPSRRSSAPAAGPKTDLNSATHRTKRRDPETRSCRASWQAAAAENCRARLRDLGQRRPGRRTKRAQLPLRPFRRRPLEWPVNGPGDGAGFGRGSTGKRPSTSPRRRAAKRRRHPRRHCRVWRGPFLPEFRETWSSWISRRGRNLQPLPAICSDIGVGEKASGSGHGQAGRHGGADRLGDPTGFNFELRVDAHPRRSRTMAEENVRPRFD